MYPNGIRSYRKTNVVTADPGRLVIMCYEGAIDQLKIAMREQTEEQFERKTAAIVKSQDIINELLCSLDFEKGGAIAGNLESLYNYMIRRILQADVRRDTDGIEEVIGMLEELKAAWESAFEKRGKQVRSQPNADRPPQQPAGGRISV